MREIPHWTDGKTIRVAESKSGVLVTVHPDDNLVASVKPWPTPELLQKCYASSRFVGKTLEDAEAAESGLGHYCDLQSLNSEDAVTWSFFGNLAYAPDTERLGVFNRILESIGCETVGDAPNCWLWRRISHPEKPESSGGPEIDFAFLSESTLLLGEAKWNSGLGQGQGVDGNRSQLYLRAKYCDGQAAKALPSVRNFVILGVGRSGAVFDGSDATLTTGASVNQLSWEQVRECFSGRTAAELNNYLAWKVQYSSLSGWEDR